MPIRVWVLALNDGEAEEIVSLLEECCERSLVSQQRWGASWAALETEIQLTLHRFRNENPKGEIVGIELSGTNNFEASNIDHHFYDDEPR